MRLVLALLGLLAAVPAAAQHFPELQGQPVLDTAGIIPDDRERALDARLMQFERETGRQVMVATVKSLEGYEIEDYANGLFRQVKLGRHDINDGVLLLVAPNEKKTRIEVGRGLDPYLTDALSSFIIQGVMLPRFKEGDFPAGIEGGVDGIIKEVTPDAITKKQEQAKLDQIAHRKFMDGLETFFSWVLMILTAAGGIFGIYWLSTSKQRALRRLEKACEEERARQEANERAAARRAAEAAMIQRERERAAAAARERAERIARESPEERRMRLAAEAAAAEAERAREEERRRRRREDEQRRERERAEERRRNASDNWSSNASSGSISGGDSGGGFSGGGGDSGGAGASGSW